MDAVGGQYGEISIDESRNREDITNYSDGSSPSACSNNRSEGEDYLSWGSNPIIGNSHSTTGSSNPTIGNIDLEWEEVGTMKEMFAKLLLGEDMSGRGKGVSSALALSNAISNVSAQVFGELHRLQPLPAEKKKLWKREMSCLIAVANHIIELVPSLQTLPDGISLEVMVTRPRLDLYINLPALKKIDMMLLGILESFQDTEFWYVEQGMVNSNNGDFFYLNGDEEKCCCQVIPSPRVPINGLSNDAKIHLQKQRDYVHQILKASIEINSQILLEMDTPDVYLDALPKSARASLTEMIHKCITSAYISPDELLGSLDLSTEDDALEVANQIEAAIHIWRRKLPRQNQNPLRDMRSKNNADWAPVKELMRGIERRETLAERAENLLLCLKQKLPNLPHTLLDRTKIRYNKDVGKAILEGYSRAMESLAFNILARIDDVLYIDDIIKNPPYTNIEPFLFEEAEKSCVDTPYGTSLATPNASPNHQNYAGSHRIFAAVSSGQ